MQPNTNYGDQQGTPVGNTPVGNTGATYGTTTGTNVHQQGEHKEGMMDKVKGMVGMGHKEHGEHGHHHGIVPPGAPSKEDHTLYKKGSSSSSSSSDEEVTRKERVVGTETLAQRGIPRQYPAEHVKEGTTNLPVQRVPASADVMAANVDIPKRYPSEHIKDERPGMYNGPTEYVGVNKATTGVQGMNLTGEKKVTAVGTEADKLEARDRAMGKPVEKEGAHTFVEGGHKQPHGAVGTGGTAGATTAGAQHDRHTPMGAGVKEPMQGRATGQPMHDGPAGVLGAGGVTAKPDRVETNQAGTHGTHDTHGQEQKPSMMDKVKGMLPGHHKH